MSCIDKNNGHGHKVDTVIAWFTENGGTIHPAVEITSSEVDGYFLRVREDETLTAASRLVDCPHNLTISVMDMDWAYDSWPESFKLQWRHSPEVLTRFFLIEQFLKKEKSFWWPYLRMLPQPYQLHLLNTPMWYEESDCVWIKGTNLEGSRTSRQAAWRQEYDESIALLSRDDQSRSSRLHLYEWILYKWAATILTSRCFPGTALAHRSISEDDPDAANKRNIVKRWTEDNTVTFPVLLPVFDLANHSPSAKVSWEWRNSNCSFITDQEITGGTEVLNNYGFKGNEELIMGYGFSIKGNNADAFALALATSKSKNVRYVREKEKAIRQQQECSITPAELIPTDPKIKGPSNETTSESKMSNDLSPLNDNERGHLKATHPSSQIFLLRPPTGEGLSSINQDLLDILSIIAANQRELTSFHTNSARFSIRHLDCRPTRNDVTVACRLLEFLQQQHGKITKHNDHLPPLPQNVKQFNAARYRRSQLHILQSVMITLKGFLSDVVSMKRRVARLEDIASNSPPTFSTQFRAALHCTLGTRKPQKLRKEGYQDLVFTIWACTLWFCYADGDKRVVHQNTVNRFHKDVFDWLTFIRATYCPPPGLGDNICSKSCCSIHQWTTRDDDEAMEERAVAESYLEVIRVAAEANPGSLYADSRWTANFLRWGYHIIQEEGFTCPNLDDDDDGGPEDEFMLFLENGVEEGI